MEYKHTQVGYLMIVVTLFVFAVFFQTHIAAIQETPSPDSGTNLLVTSLMVGIIFILISMSILTVFIDKTQVGLKFGFGIYRRKFQLNNILSAHSIKNKWYYGWGIRWCAHPRTWIYNVSGFDAVEIRLLNGKIYRIGTDEPEKLAAAIQMALKK